MSTQTRKTKQLVLLAGLLLGLLLGIIAFIVWTDSQQAQRATDTATNERNIVTSLRISRPKFPDITFSRIQDTWRITAQCDIAVNQSRLAPLLGLINPAALSYSALEVDLEAAGLVSPQATLYFNEERLDIGNTDLGGERRYILRGDRVEFAPEWVLALVSGGLSAFADPIIFPDSIQSLTLTHQSDNAIPLTGVPSDWQTLTAQQVVSLPLPENNTLIDTWQVSVELNDLPPMNLNLLRYASFAALIHEGAACAYVIATDALPTALR